MATPTNSWTQAFSDVGQQGRPFDTPLSATGQYFAFLSKEDLDETTGTYDVMFEVIPREWTVNAILSPPTDIQSMAPPSPASIFHVRSAAPDALLGVLGLRDAAYLAEGSWYLLALASGPAGEGGVDGDLYDPDIDIDPNRPDHGTYHITGATLIGLPQMTPRGIDSGGAPPWETPDQAKILGPIRARLAQRFRVYGKPLPQKQRQMQRQRVAEAGAMAPGVPPVDSVGIMDVGQGNCNMLIVGDQPIAYYDIGYPLFFYSRSAPLTLRPFGGAYIGPILQNQTNNLEIILSHWDWDHWRLGRIANLVNLPWIVPVQPVGPTTSNFIATLNDRYVYPADEPFLNAPRFDLYRCVPPPGAPPAMLMNNSGIALRFQTQLPAVDETWHDVIMTADANFDTLPVVYAGVTGITAVHHGSDNHHASNNLPPQSAGYNDQGCVIFSYGVYQNAAGLWRHPYGHPAPDAVANYYNTGWIHMISTAEGGNINANPPNVGARGNVRVGDQTQLDAAYHNTAFFDFPNPVH